MDRFIANRSGTSIEANVNAVLYFMNMKTDICNSLGLI